MIGRPPDTPASTSGGFHGPTLPGPGPLPGSAVARRPGHPLRWVPPFVLGFACALVAELAAGLLLYSGPGLLRALTLVLTAEAAAMAVGLTLTPPPEHDPVEVIRRRWIHVLLAFSVGAGTTLAWYVRGGFVSAGWAQGLGLGLLAVLPLFAAGSLLAALGAAAVRGRAPAGSVPWALFGAAAGFAAAGLALVPLLPAPTAYLVTLVLLSGAALLHGRVLDDRGREADGAPGPAGERREPDGVAPLRVPPEGHAPEAAALRGWEEAALHVVAHRVEGRLRGTGQAAGSSLSVLVVGPEGSALASRLAHLLPGLRAELLDDPATVTARVGEEEGSPAAAGSDAPPSALPASRWGDDDGSRAGAGGGGGPWTVVVVDGRAWAGADGELDEGTLESLALHLVEDGLLLVGGLEALPPGDGAPGTPPGRTARRLSRVGVYQRRAGPAFPDPLPDEDGEAVTTPEDVPAPGAVDVLLVLARLSGPGVPLRAGPLHLRAAP